MSNLSIFLFFLNKFIYLFLAALGLRCCTLAFSSFCEWGLLFVVVCGPLFVVAFPFAEHRLQAHRLEQLWHVGSRVQAKQLWHMGSAAPWHVGSPGPGLKPLSPAPAAGFSTTVPPGKPSVVFVCVCAI